MLTLGPWVTNLPSRGAGIHGTHHNTGRKLEEIINSEENAVTDGMGVLCCGGMFNMGVSENTGIPKSSILIWVPLIFGNTHMLKKDTYS